MKPVRTWILIADGARARIVMNDGPNHGIKAVKGMDFRIQHTESNGHIFDDPHHHFHSTSSGFQVMEFDTETHLDEKHLFAGELANVLEGELHRNSFDRMIIFAAPAMLGELRTSLSPMIMNKVIEQVPKDLTNVPHRQLSRHIENVLAI